MAMVARPAGGSEPAAFRMVSGFEILEEWFEHATQSQRNIVSRILLSVAGKSVFSDFNVINDIPRSAEFFVLTKIDLTVKIRLHDLSSFGVVYIGPVGGAPGLVAAVM
jgi:hypothetical protein